MENQMIAQDHDIQVILGKIVFNEYDMLKAQALEVATRLKTVEVTDKNIKESKKLLATVNKSVDGLEARRIEIKREMLQPYLEFEREVKEIVGIVKEANNLVKDQVRAMEEQEREVKLYQITTIFNDRIDLYSFGGSFTVDDFITPQHLNKTATMNKIEDQMIEWLTAIEKDFAVIGMLPNAQDVTAEYLQVKNLAEALGNVGKRDMARLKAKEVIKASASRGTVTPDEHYIKVFSDVDLRLVKMFLNETNIKFEEVKI